MPSDASARGVEAATLESGPHRPKDLEEVTVAVGSKVGAELLQIGHPCLWLTTLSRTRWGRTGASAPMLCLRSGGGPCRTAVFRSSPATADRWRSR